MPIVPQGSKSARFRPKVRTRGNRVAELLTLAGQAARAAVIGAAGEVGKLIVQFIAKR